MVENLLNKLKEVFEELNSSETYYRQIHNNSVDIEDFELSQKTQSDAYLKIRKLKEWENIILSLNNDITETYVVKTIPASVIDDEESLILVDDKESYEVKSIEEPEQETSQSESEEQEIVGDYIRSKMQELSESGFIFSRHDIYLMSGNPWSKSELGLDYPFIKIYNNNHVIVEQIKDDEGNYRYWGEVFKFGKFEVLIANEWFERNRNRFDIWYSRLDENNVTTKEFSDDEEKTDKCEEKEDGCTYKNPKSIRLFNKQYPVRYWNEVLIKVCEIMMIKKPYNVARFNRELSLNSDQCKNFSYVESEIKFNKKRLSNGLWVETFKNAKEIIKMSKKILELCGFSEDVLTIDFE